jgi:membrane-associated phospholipid phosphatase
VPRVPGGVSILLGILVAAVLAGGVILAASNGGSRRRPHDPTDVEVPERWLVAAASRWPRVQRAARHVDRRVWGGAALVVALVIVLVAALAVGWIFSTIDNGRGVARWDQSVADWGADRSTDAAVTAVTMVTHLGGTPFLIAVLSIVGLVEWRRRRDPTSLLFLLVVGIGVSAINNSLKWLIMRDRPAVVHLIDAAGSSFPSGHAAAAAACWMAVAVVVGRSAPRRARPWVAACAVAIAGAVAASRALLGVHWLTDVIAGLLVGWTWFALVALAFGGRLQRFGEPVERLEIDETQRRTEVRHGR